jgi:hypothetical protein
MNALEWFGIVILPAFVFLLSWGAYFLTRPRRGQDGRTRAP